MAKIIGEKRALNETVEITCETCGQKVELEAQDLERLDRRFGKDPMTYVAECANSNCGRIMFISYKDLITANPNIMFKLYNMGKGPRN